MVEPYAVATEISGGFGAVEDAAGLDRAFGGFPCGLDRLDGLPVDNGAGPHLVKAALARIALAGDFDDEKHVVRAFFDDADFIDIRGPDGFKDKAVLTDLGCVPGNRLSVDIGAAPVDVGQRNDCAVDRGEGLVERGTGCDLVLKLVDLVVDQVCGGFEAQRCENVLANFIEAGLATLDDLVHDQKMYTEDGFRRAGNLAGTGVKHGIADSALEIATCHEAKRDVILAPSEHVGSDGSKVLAARYARKRRLRGVHVVKHHLPDTARFRCGEFIEPVGIGGFYRAVADVDAVRKHLRLDAADTCRTQCRRVVAALHLLKPACQLIICRNGDAVGVNREGHDAGIAPLELESCQRACHGSRLRGAGRQRVDNLFAAQRGADPLQIVCLAEPGTGQDTDETCLRELVIGVLE